MLVMDTLAIIDEPFTFTQYRPLTSHQFISEASKYGLWLSEQELEAWHRVRLLVPFYRVARDRRQILSANRRGEDAYHLAHWQPTSSADLTAAYGDGRLHDPATERFISRQRMKRRMEGWSYESSTYLYSHHQLTAVPMLRAVRPELRFARTNNAVVGRLADPGRAKTLRERANRLRDAAVAITLLEPAYYSRIFRQLSLPTQDDFAAFGRWQRTRRLLRPLRLLDVDAAWIKDAAQMLHWEADRIDPLGEWAEVVAAGAPEKWKGLSGDARAALELRLSAEFLLLYCDDLHSARRALPLPQAPPRTRGVFDARPRRQRALNALLTDFGLSPHPRLVVAVEGETELVIFPRVLEQLGVPTDDDFIAVENAGGVDRDLSPLVAYAAAPRVDVDAETGGRYSRLTRPPTRLLVVFDAEGEFATSAERRDRRDKWVNRLLQTLPSDMRTPIVAQQIRPFVTVTTWTRTGRSFEFAHFTDVEIATAAAALDRRQRQPTRTQRIAIVTKLRAERGNLDKMLGPVSKVALAEELWPILDAKIERALARGTERRIPIIRAVHQAYALATEYPRRNLVIALEG
jgi:hypothetical protein